jgi:selenide, water dikinase
MGIVEIDTILMVLGVCTKMNDKEKAVTTSLMIKGFDDTAAEAGTSVTGGQTVLNPWPMIGGTAISVVNDKEYILPNGAENGDIILLTKPLGTQVVVNVQQWLTSGNLKWEKAQEFVTAEEVDRAYKLAMRSMSTLNLEGAKLMRKYGAKSATDVTGFGILGHAGYLAKANKKKIDFRIHTLPIIAKMHLLDKEITNFK